MNEKIPNSMILWFFLFLFFISIIMLGWLLWSFVSIIILGAVITGVFNPIYIFLNKRKISSNTASLITCVLIFFVLFVPIGFCISILSREAYDLYLMTKSAMLSNQIRDLLKESKILDKANIVAANFNMELTGSELNKSISEIGKVVGLFLYEQASAIASNVFNLVANFFFMLIVIYFLLIDGNKFVPFISGISPLPKEQDDKLIQKFKDISGAILIGNGLGGLIQGVLGGVVFMLFGIKSPFLWGVIMGLLAFLPIIGIGTVFIPTAIYFFLKGQVGAGIFFIVFYVMLSGGIEYIFKPKLVGQRVKMHTLLVFFSIIGGLKTFGILGIIYGPLIVTAFLTLTDIYHASYERLVGQKKLV